MEIGEFQHPDSRRKKSSSNGKVSLWLPYFDGIEKAISENLKDHYFHVQRRLDIGIFKRSD